MAQTGFTPIQLYYSTTASTAPTAGNLANGELAINITDGKLYYKDNGGVVQVLATKGAGTVGGSNTQVQYNSSGALAGSANMTFDGTTLTAAGLSTGGSLTLSGGTANGVAYLNGSKVLTTGSALAFDGTYLTANGLRLAGADVTNTIYQATGALGLSTGSASGITFATNLTQRYSIDGTGVSAWSVGGSEQMRLTSTGLGIGTSSPANKLDVLSTAFAIARFSRSGAGGSAGIDIVEGSGGYSRLATPGGTSNMSFRPGGTELMLLDSSGNLGLGVTPSTVSLGPSLQIANGAVLQSLSGGYTELTNNAIYNSGFKYISTGTATLYESGAGAHKWSTAASGGAGTAITFTQAMTLDASGNLALGTTTQKVTQFGGSATGMTIGSATYPVLALWDTADASYNFMLAQDGGTAYVFNNANGPLTFSTNATERARIDSSGNLLVGTTSAYRSGKLVVKATNLTQTSATANLQISTTDSQGVNLGGSIGLGGQVGGDEVPFGYISGRKENSTSGNYAGYLAFATINGGATVTEAGRFDSSGNLLVGTTTSGGWNANAKFETKTTAAGSAVSAYFAVNTGGQAILCRVDGTTPALINFFSTTTNVGSITSNGTTTSYNITSDQRLKQNIQDAADAASLIDSLQVRQFDWKVDNSHQRYGFVAQELLTVAPEAVHQPTNSEDMMSVDYSKLVPMLVKEIQSLRTRLSALEAK